MRGQLIDLFTDYQARVRVVYVEASAKHLARQNANREKVVPAAVIRAMMDRWEVPSVVEADGVEWWVDGEMVGWEKSANTEILTSSE
jgi:tRNA uridine 5-carbamoylmethylation protein Kti12